MEDLRWVKAKASSDSNGCVEVAALPGGGRAVRDSKNPGVVLSYTEHEWACFTDGFSKGEFDNI